MAIADSISGLYTPFHQSSPDYSWNTTLTNNLTPDNLNYTPLTNFLAYSKVFFGNGYVPNNGLNPVGEQWSEEWFKFARQERVFGYFMGSWGLQDAIMGTIVNNTNNFYSFEGAVDTTGKWNICQGPQAYQWGGVWIMVNSHTDNGFEVRDFISKNTSNSIFSISRFYNTVTFPNSPELAEFLADLVDENGSENYPIVQKNLEIFGGQNYIRELAKISENITVSPFSRTQYDQALGVAAVETAIRNAHPTADNLPSNYTSDQNLDFFQNHTSTKKFFAS
jgi:hypothetical protein